ncbi:YHYH protein [Zobellia galactanivorans]|uniref:YHYH protein n=1 Tax=Zobellia galactanivorans (strain DSM 12802 / CCUG 47099 / CIP 106680 / NCIMB 13871 / Dsij) TaxID=63186 RepID=UPI001C072B69|nr:YHYH protein [Zobellia galactanivorans]MBU3026042.1 YHYH protein [Zobellia galactanivorans]
MKHTLNLYLLAFLIWSFTTSCSDSNPSDEELVEETDDVNHENDISVVLELFEGTGLSYELTDDSVIFTTADLPDHESPYWDPSHELYAPYDGNNPDFNQNPNKIEEKNIVITVPLHPTAASINEATRLGPIGISRNGVVFFNQYAGPNNQPLTFEVNSFDQGAGHPTGTNMYHYHIEPLSLTEAFGTDAFLGLLADGFPVYGPMENGKVITNDDLDEFHGHIGSTAQFPDGIYHYHITDADPYLNGNGFYGSPGNISQ